MHIFRVFELLPLAVTSLIPVVLLPMMGIVDTEEISHFYMKVIIKKPIKTKMILIMCYATTFFNWVEILIICLAMIQALKKTGMFFNKLEIWRGLGCSSSVGWWSPLLLNTQICTEGLSTIIIIFIKISIYAEHSKMHWGSLNIRAQEAWYHTLFSWHYYWTKVFLFNDIEKKRGVCL